jgi:hypothetical protein
MYEFDLLAKISKMKLRFILEILEGGQQGSALHP